MMDVWRAAPTLYHDQRTNGLKTPIRPRQQSHLAKYFGYVASFFGLGDVLVSFIQDFCGWVPKSLRMPTFWGNDSVNIWGVLINARYSHFRKNISEKERMFQYWNVILEFAPKNWIFKMMIFNWTYKWTCWLATQLSTQHDLKSRGQRKSGTKWF